MDTPPAPTPSPSLDEIAVRPLKPNSKDVRVVKVIVETAACHREHKYPADDPRSKCHLGYTKIEWNACTHCTWFGFRPPASTKVLTGGEAMAVMGTLQTIKETHRPMQGEPATPPGVVLGGAAEPPSGDQE